jgi:hypothetical protein
MLRRLIVSLMALVLSISSSAMAQQDVDIAPATAS